MATGLQMEGIYFTADGLKGCPTHAASLGEIVTAFSLIEGVVGGIYGMLRHQNIDQGVEELQKLSTNAKRVNAVRKEIGINALLSDDASHDELMKRVLNYAEKRNKIAHGVWGSRLGQQDFVYCLPVKKFINFMARAVSAGTSGKPLELMEELKAHVEIYDLAALAALKLDGENLLTEVFVLFNKLAQKNAKSDGWLEEPMN
ncbi:hypothetical protein [Xanthomonas vesicatoria]|uniref:hypothetical protein n=2 Tax=Xanthomonas vesicatoria TaxID=56460 RepID=UPI000A879035|nr:hypothetical protein [Xanthomonas vesicatoria]MCC8556489.1 hypothetical protein [Xanthomonas vesicatoria]MCC8599852.1 hypothetical protein [Xanthomonas vesicatoria]MCC8608447.1 hypothetical protein [Xanthomonas vesicatoria]MCC8672358.1 hypothetical protein [Xanthomonas vesicatoria]MCC8676124.1 hypothetical protein [Xanthomonas vesicatoria]